MIQLASMANPINEAAYASKKGKNRYYPKNAWNEDDISIWLQGVRDESYTTYSVTVRIYSQTFWANTQYKVDACVRAARRFVAEDKEFSSRAKLLSETLLKQGIVPGNKIELQVMCEPPNGLTWNVHSLTLTV